MTYFTERQRFTQWWVWLIILATPILIFLIPSIASIKPYDTEGILINIVIIAAIILLFLSVRLNISISDAGIRYRFFPFHLHERSIPWTDIDRAYIRKYEPITEYGGWGIRVLFGSGAYNIKGNMGLQLELTNGKKILLGTQRSEEIESVLRGIEK